MRAKEGLWGGAGLISALLPDGVVTKPCFYRKHSMGRGAGFFSLAGADGDRVCWLSRGREGPSCCHPGCCKSAGRLRAALALPAQAAGPRGLPGELTCCLHLCRSWEQSWRPLLPPGRAAFRLCQGTAAGPGGLVQASGQGDAVNPHPHFGSGILEVSPQGSEPLPMVCGWLSALADCSCFQL